MSDGLEACGMGVLFWWMNSALSVDGLLQFTKQGLMPTQLRLNPQPPYISARPLASADGPRLDPARF